MSPCPHCGPMYYFDDFAHLLDHMRRWHAHHQEHARVSPDVDADVEIIERGTCIPLDMQEYCRRIDAFIADKEQRRIRIPITDSQLAHIRDLLHQADMFEDEAREQFDLPKASIEGFSMDEASQLIQDLNAYLD